MARPLLLRRRPQLPSYICRACLRCLSVIRKAPEAPARTRFAPSPTGYLHLGSLRTALFNYLLAKRTGGQFILRVEDTDQKRTIADAEQRLVQDLHWAQLQWDEGPDIGGPKGPYRQSERTETYRKAAQKLLDSGNAYRCFCSPERLNALAQHRHKLGLATDYDRTCASISPTESDSRAAKGEAYTVRFKVPDQHGAWQDLVHGAFKPIKRPAHVIESSFEDPILLKSDGFPTYHLANIVDDHLMDITHVIRGSEWMPSTPNHIAMYNAFAWKPPKFVHVGLLVDSAGNKLSKRNFDTDISAFKEMEIFPETLTNFAALLGWSHREQNDIMDLPTLVKNFSLKFTKGNTTVTFGKMQFLQRKHALIRAMKGGDKFQEMVNRVTALLSSPDSPYPDWHKVAAFSPIQPQDKYIAHIIQVDADNYTNSNEFVYRNAYFFTSSPPSRTKTHTSPESPASDASLLHDGATLDDIPQRIKLLALLSPQDWTRENLAKKMHEIIDGRPEGRPGGKKVYHYLRLALTGQNSGMRLYDILMILGREESLRRLGWNEGDEIPKVWQEGDEEEGREDGKEEGGKEGEEVTEKKEGKEQTDNPSI